ncbi:MAG: TIGR03915 family putative DNA repair protein [Candidatus Aureabacteria bacterium]|nr:TIGR03915 family putative DNA repair protein [Candidatus Auribacterota bacterium]
MSATYIYDGTYEGLMTCLAEVLKKQEEPDDIVFFQDFTPSLFSREVTVETKKRKAESFLLFVKNKMGKDTLRNIMKCFLSDVPGKGMMIYDYVKLGIEKGKNLDLFLSDERVSKIHTLSMRVGREAHRMKGLLRFKELFDGVYYARLYTDHFILPLIAPFFAGRLADRCWIIHDYKRSRAAFYNKRAIRIAQLERENVPLLSSEEIECQMLWKRYFQKIAVPGRYNPRLQRQFIPKKYWRDLVEVEESIVQGKRSAE